MVLSPAPEMSLGRFATIVGASPRWVQNALQVLELPRKYDEVGARTLGLARELHEELGLPLGNAYSLAVDALSHWPATDIWRRESPTGVGAIEVDLRRYLSGYASRLALARSWYSEKKRGRPRKRRKGVAGAREYGVDVGLLRASLERTPEERLQRLDEDLRFLAGLRVRES